MNIVAYFQNLTTSGTGGSYISLSVWGVIAIFVLTGLIFGFKRGFYRSVIRLITVAIAAVASYFIAASVGGIIYTHTEGMTLLEMFDAAAAAAEAYMPGISDMLTADLRALIDSFDAEVASELVALVSGLLLAPISFAVSFYVFRLASWIIYWLMCWIFK